MKIALCDDNQKILDIYGDKIRSIALKNNVDMELFPFKSGESLLFEMSEDINSFDVIFMEIVFPNKRDGLELCRDLRKKGYGNEIIFLTNDKERVFDAFDVEPLHYLLKDNISDIDMEEVFLRAVEKSKAKKREILPLSYAGGTRNIIIDSILYFEVVQRIIVVHYDNNQTFEFYSTIGKLEILLMKKGFIRVHRAYLVAVAHIVSIKNGLITLKNGEKIPIGRTYAKKLRETINRK